MPGLAAKPVIDILAPVRELREASAAIPQLEADGWLLWRDDPYGYRLWFLTPSPEHRTHHLQLIAADAPQAAALLAFRDALRADDALAADYAALKRRLAVEHRDDRDAYTDAKADFVHRVLDTGGGAATSQEAAILTGVASKPAPPTKDCAACGRTITWRKKWERNWQDVRWCSDACRRRGVSATDTALEAAIRELLGARAITATICPSEAAKRVGGEAWRELMEPARAAARRLVVTGEMEITQGGRPVDPSSAKGPIRVRRVER